MFGEPEQYRHEFKYEIDDLQLQMLKMKLPSVMELDSHVARQGRYQIRSLYFDDFYNSCYYENENGTDPREKFRIRIYNGSLDRIQLELKRKEAGKTLKKSCPLNREQLERLVNGERFLWQEDMHPLLKKLYILQETKGMRPKVIVEYERIPYIHDDGNVRVTLDLDVRASSNIKSFINPQTDCRPIMPCGKQLLEVKYDNFLPDWIYRTVQMKGLRQTAFSKYYLCRKFGGNL
ncbi:MAG: polyphosphate polymerase domain-containing protein [Oscillospiraceae bacterium]|nr:polyphosphate polymerase domain-containing protein [Candidatus Equicaccousia limihippi]